MGCPACGAGNPVTAKFCQECGSPQPRRCPACGHDVGATAKFCPECGERLGGATPRRPAPSEPAAPQTYTPRHLAEKILASRDVLAGERKQVTVLFADVVGSTELIRDLDPEDAQRLLDGAVTRMMDAVHQYEGTVCRLLGDGLMALFGAPIAHEDHALRACYAALALQGSIRTYAQEVRRDYGLGIEARVGLNSGEVIVRLISDDLHMDYTALGQAVHLASRMEQVASPGGIALTPDTLALTKDHIEARSLGPLTIKGLSGPLEVFTLLGAGPRRTRLQAAAFRGLTRLVGRQSELASILASLDRATNGRGQVVALVGEPGIGKSRLAWEVAHARRMHAWLILETSAIPHGQDTPYLPVIELLKAYCRIDAHDDLQTIHAKVTGRILALDATLVPFLPPLLALLDVRAEDQSWGAPEPAQRRRQILDAVRNVLLRLSRAQPLLLLFEDLQWIDSETQALLDELVERVPTARVVLLVTYRPEYMHRWGNRSSYTQVRINPLPTDNIDELLVTMLGSDPSLRPVNNLLIRRAEGNPFFLEESVRDLVEDGALLGDPGERRLVHPIAAVRVPATIQAILAARIDRLPIGAKQVLQAAAVIGRNVPWVLLQEIAGLPLPDLQAALAHLRGAELLHEGSVFPELEYAFNHALTHDVAYGSLLVDRRKALHAGVVEAIEAAFADRLEEHAEELADHAMRGETWERAAIYAHQAGKRAADRSANRTAVSFFNSALIALAHLPPTRQTGERGIDLREDLHDALFPLAEIERLPVLHAEAMALAESIGDEARLSRVIDMHANLLWRTGQFAAAKEAAHRALALCERRGDRLGQSTALSHLAAADHFSGDWRASTEIYERIVHLLSGVVTREHWGIDTFTLLHAKANLAFGLAEIGEVSRAIRVGVELVAWAEDTGHAFTIERACASLGHVYLQQGDAERAVTLFERARDTGTEHSYRVSLPWILSELGAAYALRGQLDRACALADQAETADASSPIVSGRSGVLIRLAEISLRAGQRDRAEHLVRSATAQAVERGERGYLASTHWLRGVILACSESASDEPAAGSYRKALLLAGELGMRPLQARCHLGLGKLLRRTGRLHEAHAELSTAVAMLREMGMVFWLPEAKTELDQARQEA